MRQDFTTLAQMLAAQAETRPTAIALLGQDRPPLSYARLHRHLRESAARLHGHGIDPTDRVAIVLPNGPVMAAAFLAVASYATSAPLNPGYRLDEFEFYLADLQARAIVLPADSDSPAREAAAKLGVAVLDLVASEEAAGLFHLDGSIERLREAPAPPAGAPAGAPAGEDIALILHTSGTTARPKMTPLSQRNLTLSAQNVARSLQLSPSDRCLNVMPLFHIHGLVAALLASLSAGASVACTPGFEAERFFGWLALWQPTWYTAVPTMHQAILAQGRMAGVAPVSRLRFLRSSSASLPPPVMAELETVFQAPVIEAYGMTEASHQMASNPLPPAVRKPGSVGRPAGPEVAIMAEDGDRLLPEGERGEVVIRGKNVAAGYLANPSANARAFSAGWFRTGDQGYFDEDGYLFLTGRLKEMINRGGEKVTPREIDEALMQHPAVAQAVAFAVPHPTLGEDVAAVVVLRPGQTITAAELRAFAFDHLSDFKVPSQIVIIASIPKGATGKLQRIGLAEMLGGQLRPAFIAPATLSQQTVAALWREVLGQEAIGIHDNFFALGGDSLTAARVVSRLNTMIGISLPLADAFRAPTVAEMATRIEVLLAQQLHEDDAGGIGNED